MVRSIIRPLIWLLPLALLSGYLLSQASWAGRTGINLVYRQYQFLNTWWQAGLAVYFTWIMLYLVQQLVIVRTSAPTQKKYLLVSLSLCLALWAFAFYDFSNTATHRLLGAKFHWGAYLFFVGWLWILFYGWSKRRKGAHKP